MSQSTGNTKYLLMGVRIGARIESVISLINVGEFAYVLSASGYTVNQNPRNPEHVIGTKGTAEAYFDGSRRVFGVNADTIENATSIMNELLDLIAKSPTKNDIRPHISFYEIQIDAMYQASQDGYLITTKVLSDSEQFKKLGAILGGQYAQFGLKLVPKGISHNTKEWRDLTIEPRVGGGNLLIIRSVSRSENLDKLVDAAKETEEQVTKIIETVLLK